MASTIARAIAASAAEGLERLKQFHPDVLVSDIAMDGADGYELIRRVNALRKESGLALSDRIALTIPAQDADLLEHADWIKAETLAVSLDALDDVPTITRA